MLGARLMCINISFIYDVFRMRIDQIMNITCLLLTLIEFFYSVFVVVRLVRNINK